MGVSTAATYVAPPPPLPSYYVHQGAPYVGAAPASTSSLQARASQPSSEVKQSRHTNHFLNLSTENGVKPSPSRLPGTSAYRPVARVPTGLPDRLQPRSDNLSTKTINRLPTSVALKSTSYSIPSDPVYNDHSIKRGPVQRSYNRLGPSTRPGEYRTIARVPTGPDHASASNLHHDAAHKQITRLPTDIFQGHKNAGSHHQFSPTNVVSGFTPLHKAIRKALPASLSSPSPLASPAPPTPVASSRRVPPSTPGVSSRLTLQSSSLSKGSCARPLAMALTSGMTTATPAASSLSATPSSSMISQNPAAPLSRTPVASGFQPAYNKMNPARGPLSKEPVSLHGLDYKAIKELLLRKLDAKNLNAAKIIKEASSQIRALCVSPNSGKCYKITRVLQSAIYGGVFEADTFAVKKVLDTPLSVPICSEKRIALKIMLRDLELQNKDSLQEDITAEFRFQKEMRGHRNVLAYDELWESQSKGIIYVVMPYAEFEDLFEVLKRRNIPFSESEARWLFRQLLLGVQHLHNQGLGFRDHSLENVLMFRDEMDGVTIVPRITDPGQAVRFRYDNHRREVCCMYAEKLFGKSFRPPEVYNPRKYNPIKVDVFCIGWMLFFVVTKRQAFDRTMDSDPHWKYVAKGDFEELLRIKGNAKISSKLISLLRNMLHPQYEHRYTPQECLDHPWFKEPECTVDDRTIWASSPNCVVTKLGPNPNVKRAKPPADSLSRTYG